MKDEILAKALDSDTEIVPRYDVVLPDGTKVAENAELVLKNPVTQEGTPYNKEAVLQDATAALYGLGDNATVDDVFGVSPYLDWKEIARFDEAGAFTWTADFDGEIGLFIMGGGGVGAGLVYSRTSVDYSLSGGGSGYIKSVVLNVQSGEKISIIVGAGGTITNGPGGSSSVTIGDSSLLAEGGNAGRSGSSLSSDRYIVPGGAPAYMRGNGYYGTEDVTYFYSSNVPDFYWPMWHNVNPFTGEEVCGSGGGAYNSGPDESVKAFNGGKKPLTNLGGGNAVGVITGNAQGENASLPGCGGGAATTRQSGGTATPGNGADGIVIIYRKIEVNA